MIPAEPASGMFTHRELRDIGAVLSIQAPDCAFCASLVAASRSTFPLSDDEFSAVIKRFSVAFDPKNLRYQTPDIFLFRPQKSEEAPYLIHAGYELPLLLDGRKKLARMSHEYPPDNFEGEDRFDHWVSAGIISRVEINEPFDSPIRGWLGHRTVYYTRAQEEWRVPAMRMLVQASGNSGGWNEYFERLEGTLFGYSDEENDWWINVGLLGGGFGGVSLCCAVSHEGLAWVEAAGFRAFPPSNQPTVKMSSYWRDTENEVRDLLFDDPTVSAIVRFNVLGRHVMDILDPRQAGPWEVPSEQIPQINRHIRGSVIVFAHRDSPPAPNDPRGA